MSPSPSPRQQAEAQARNRFIVITALRFGGVGLVMLGFAIARGTFDLPWIVGAGVALVGFLDFFFVPWLLARQWKKQDARRR